MKGLIVRRAVKEDVAAMCDLLADLFSVEPDFVPDLERQRLGIAMLLKRPNAAVFVAEAGGRAIGMCTVQTLVSTAEGGMVGLIEDVVIKRGFRGRGIGTALLDKAYGWAREQGLLRLQLLADKENGPALKFYGYNGWTKTRLICLRKKPA